MIFSYLDSVMNVFVAGLLVYLVIKVNALESKIKGK